MDMSSILHVELLKVMVLRKDIRHLLDTSCTSKRGNAKDCSCCVLIAVPFGASPQVIALAEYRAQLYDYLKNRMLAISPNLTTLVGELVGARLIAHAGSLVNLAKQPASTLQVHPPHCCVSLKTKQAKHNSSLKYESSELQICECRTVYITERRVADSERDGMCF
jgi:hypothetical protein